MKRLAVVLLLLALCAIGFAQDQMAPKKEEASTKPVEISTVFERQLSNVEREIVPLAEAMPEDKYDFAPKDGEFATVRTFAEQIRHVATTNFIIGAAILGEKSPVDEGKNENGPELKTKAEIVKELKDSFAYLHKVFATLNTRNSLEPFKIWGQTSSRLSVSTMLIGHINDHYGQCVVYLRMNGIIPPASRPAPKK